MNGMRRFLAVFLASLALAQPIRALAVEPQSCAKLFSQVGEGKASGKSPAPSRWDALVPLDGRVALPVPRAASAVARTSSFLILPRTAAEVSDLFGPRQAFTPSLMADIQKASQIASQGLPAPTYAKPEAAQESLTAFVQSLQSQFAIVIGHNEGGRLRLQGGESAAIVDVSRAIRARDSLPIIISCRSARHIEGQGVGIDYEVTYAEAARLGEAIATTIATLSAAERADTARLQLEVVRTVDRFRGKQLRGKAFAIVVKTAAGLVILGIFICLSDLLRGEDC